MSRFGQLLAMRSSVCLSQAKASTPFIFAVVSRVAMVAHVRPPSFFAELEPALVGIEACHTAHFRRTLPCLSWTTDLPLNFVPPRRLIRSVGCAVRLRNGDLSED
jgi:hypothetical protein